MKITLLHPWKVSPREAIRIQEELRKKLRLHPPRIPFKKIAAGDVSYSRPDDMTYAAFLLFSYPDLTLLERASAKGRASFPYIPGLLTFREAPILLEAFSRLKARPDLILIDGQGIAHPRSMGMASHIGLILALPSIGCAKSRLIGAHGNLAPGRGSILPLVEGNRTVGMVVRTRDGVRPLYVSPGHEIDLDTSVKIVLSLCRGYRIPEPLRQAHIFVNQLRGLKR
jgi:deoxyribonuclease V